MIECCVCDSTNWQGSETKFYPFPKNDFYRSEWIKYCKLDVYTDTSAMRLCSEHFDDTCYRNALINGPRVLKSDAVPCIALEDLDKKNIPNPDTDPLRIEPVQKRNIVVNKIIKTYPILLKSNAARSNNLKKLPHKRILLSNINALKLDQNKQIKVVINGKPVTKTSDNGEHSNFMTTENNRLQVIKQYRNISSISKNKIISNSSVLKTSQVKQYVKIPLPQKKPSEITKVIPISDQSNSVIISKSKYDTLIETKLNLELAKEMISKKDQQIKKLILESLEMKKKLRNLERYISRVKKQSEFSHTVCYL